MGVNTADAGMNFGNVNANIDVTKDTAGFTSDASLQMF